MMLCQTTTLEKAKLLGKNWTIERKEDGTRVLIKNGKILNREGKNVSFKYPELKQDLELLKPYELDGELCVLNKKGFSVFTKLLERNCTNKFKIELRSKSFPCTLILFDLLEVRGESWKSKPLEKRQTSLLEVLTSLPLSNTCFIQKFPSLEKGWSYVKEHNLEGLILKDLSSRYEERRSPYWLKCKSFKECEAEFFEWEEHPKGILVKSPDDRLRVNIAGRDGDIARHKLKQDGKVAITIQYLEKTKEGRLRFPSFKEFSNSKKKIEGK